MQWRNKINSSFLLSAIIFPLYARQATSSRLIPLYTPLFTHSPHLSCFPSLAFKDKVENKCEIRALLLAGMANTFYKRKKNRIRKMKIDEMTYFVPITSLPSLARCLLIFFIASDIIFVFIYIYMERYLCGCSV